MYDLSNAGIFSESELAQLGIKSWGRNVRIARNCMIFGAAEMTFGDDVRVDGFCTLSGRIELGSNVHVAGYCALYGKFGIVLEDFAGLSSGCRLYSASDDYSGRFMTNPTVPERFLGVTGREVRLGRHAIVGSGAVVLPGASLGEGTALGSLSLATRPLDAWTIYSGVPAKRLKARSRDLLDLEAQLLRDRGEERTHT